MKEIIAKEGMYLTQAKEVSEGRIYVTALKGINVNESDWRDATAAEKEEFEKTQAAEEEQ